MTIPTFRSLPFLPLLAALALAGCSKTTEVQPADGSMAERLESLEKGQHVLMQERDDALKAEGVAGLEAKNLGHILADLRARLKAVEDRPVAVAPAMTDPDGTTRPSTSGTTTPATPLLEPAGQDGAFTEEQIAVATRLSDEVQRRKDAAQQQARVKRELAQAGVNLTSDQEATIIKLQAQFSEKMREVWRGGFGTTDADRTAAQEKVKVLREQFEAEVRAQVPAADADKVVAALGRGNPGFVPNRRDGRTPGGMGGN